MRVTLTAIKADIGSIGGHICPSRQLLEAVDETVAREGRGVIIDYALNYTGDDVAILLSHDRGWYRPGEPDGGASQVKGFTYLVEGFLPRLREEGVSEDLITLMTVTNPKRAFRMRK